MAKSPAQLPQAEKNTLRLGYIRLTDSAPVVMALELGLFTKYGLDVKLQREVSWANLRDKVVAGALDAAQMLAPLPLVTTLGAGGMRANMITGLALSLNGNAITLSATLSSQLEALGANPKESATTAAVALRRLLDAKTLGSGITLASTHSFSCHTFQLHRWLRSGGIDPEQDLRIIILPPEQMVDSLARGIIDGYCVGEPWNTIAVQHGIGAIQATSNQLWANAIEKVLGVTHQWHSLYPATHLRLRLALMEAQSWLTAGEHRLLAASVLSSPTYLDLPERQIRPSLSGELQFEKYGKIVALPDFHVFGRYNAGFPWRSAAEELLRCCYRLLGREMTEDELKSMVQQTFRTDLYRQAARHLGLDTPDSDHQS